MRRIPGLSAAALLAISTLTVSGSAVFAGQRNTCPPVPPPGSTVNGGLLVTGNCTLVNVTVNGGATVTSTGHLELERSTVNGGVTVLKGGELDSGHTIFSFVATGLPSTINGGIKYTNGFDLDLINATVSGEVSIDSNGPQSFPALCGTHFKGTVRLSNVNTGRFLLGDPGEPINFGTPTDCPANTIDGSLFVTNSKFVEIETNTIKGSVHITNSTVELAVNKIGGSAHCKNVIFVTDGDAAPNTVRGKNTCK